MIVVRWASTSMDSPVYFNLYNPITRLISTWIVTERWPDLETTLTWADTIIRKVIVSTYWTWIPTTRSMQNEQDTAD